MIPGKSGFGSCVYQDEKFSPVSQTMNEVMHLGIR